MSTGDGDNPVSEEPRRPLARARRVVEEPIRATRAVPETPPEKDTSTDDDISSDDVSFYVREIRVIALADDDDSVPFDEH